MYYYQFTGLNMFEHDNPVLLADIYNTEPSSFDSRGHPAQGSRWQNRNPREKLDESDLLRGISLRSARDTRKTYQGVC
jgi:hypothetical protein